MDQQQEQQDATREAVEAAARAFEAARQARITVEEKCFLGLINAVKETAA